ncbi:hypothetical protein MPTK1_3g12100 [Marchantia polymorpha subsp. ruderalis]|nr:hypothetical protein MARPO_0050s0015 [Marchantia polymorpha]PTQ38541.1 hypothetical protein MARPO_0050s0015 [Marchantia polymorpha]BBN05319.1 hypothetical protein Mp_3g12100 [Marchantia polymorpha subsp. ruderalis]BBN05320.1 hypothetical protein Mp_3g12100 [Marchantia polymorpha subsp. ruderalis]|eukprot:PTQ38540.1 hypothetical protein MARPO_0050s0015 [Marchantia polymorpha]
MPSSSSNNSTQKFGSTSFEDTGLHAQISLLPKMAEHSSKSTELQIAVIRTTTEEVQSRDSVPDCVDVDPGTLETTLSMSGIQSLKKSCSFSSVQLPPELIAIILSKLPFPQIFQVKTLSTSWYTKLPSLRRPLFMPSLVQEHENSSNLSQLDVSSNWCTYCPVFVSGQEMVGYERAHKRWRKLPIHIKIPIQQQQSPSKAPFVGFTVNFVGPIMFVYRLGLEESKMMVANPLIGCWTKMEGAPTYHESSCVCKVGSEDYKIVIHHPWQHGDGYVRFETRVFDSKTKTWTRGLAVHRSLVNDGSVDYGKNFLYCAHKDGVVYCTLTSFWSRRLELWQYSIDTGLWANIPLDTRFEEYEFQTCGLFSVASQILLVTMIDRTYTNRHSIYYSESARIYRLDMKTLQLSEPWKSPPMLTRFCTSNNNHSRIVCDDECLYFIREIRRPGQGSFPIEMWSYHVSTETWSNVSSPPKEYFKLCSFLKLADGSFTPDLKRYASL